MPRVPPQLVRSSPLTISLVCGAVLAGCIDPPPGARVAAVIVDTCSGVGDGALCNDQNPCTTGDRCQGGLCLGVSAPDGTSCTDGNQCTGGDVCNRGLCTGISVADGVACTDGEPCTDPDTCRMGRCVAGPPRVCNDGMTCTMDTCVMGMGCRFVATSACPDGDAGGPTDGGPDGDSSSQPDGVDASPDLVDAQDASDASDGSDGRDGAGGPDGADALDAADGMTRPDADASPDADAGGGLDADGPEDAVMEARDAADDGGVVDAGTDGADAGDAPIAEAGPVLFEARGGACVCAIADPPSPAASLLAVALAGLLVFGRRRRR